MRHHRLMLVPCVMLAVIALPATSDASTTARVQGWQVVSSNIVASARAQTFGTATCPASKVVAGGGVLGDVTGPKAPQRKMNVNSSYPADRHTWAVWISNASRSAGNFSVYAICVQQPPHYVIVRSDVQEAPPGSLWFAYVDCPGQTLILGGGMLSDSTSTAVNISETVQSTASTSNSWDVSQDNQSAKPAAFRVYGICSRPYAGQFVYAGDTGLAPAHSISTSHDECPPGQVPLAGGVLNSNHVPLMTLNSSAPTFGDPLGWITYENNNSDNLNATHTYITCAKAVT